jgi:hypothetical protein
MQAARHRLRRLHLHDEVDGAHVDPELERRGRDEARDAPRLQVFLDDDSLFARKRAVVGARDFTLRELVQPQREPLGEAPVVDEDDRRAVRLDELQQLGVDRGPDRIPLPGLAHVLDGHDDLQVELLARARVDEPDRPSAGDEAADLLERALRGGEADALERLARQAREPLDREREVRAALRAGHRVHLVEDQGLDAAEGLARRRRQHQVERLRRRDQDVRRLVDQLAALLRGRVAGADTDAELRLQAGERPAQVPLDVVVERLQRRDVEHPQPRARPRPETVDRVEERRERLAGAGRRLDEHVLAARDRRPAELLGRRRPFERPLEPPARGG